MTGRLGNQLFHYAAILSHSRRLDYKPALGDNTHGYLDKYFQGVEGRPMEEIEG